MSISPVGAGSVVWTAGAGLLRKHRFEEGCRRVESEVEIARMRSLVHGEDVPFTVKRGEGGIILCLGKEVVKISGIEGEGDAIFYGNGWIAGDRSITFFMPKDKATQYTVSITTMKRNV